MTDKRKDDLCMLAMVLGFTIAVIVSERFYRHSVDNFEDANMTLDKIIAIKYLIYFIDFMFIMDNGMILMSLSPIKSAAIKESLAD
jgi:hypothetical protein